MWKLVTMMWNVIFVVVVCHGFGCGAEIIMPSFMFNQGPTTTPSPWQRGEIIQSKPEIVHTYPWMEKGCPHNFCDPAPVFKVVQSTPTGLGYDLLDVIYPSDDPEYQRLLLSPQRKRICNGTKLAVSKCSYFQEFVLHAGGYTPLKIISVHDSGYDDIYLRMRFITIQHEGPPTESPPSESPSNDGTEKYILYGAIIFLLIVVLIGLCAAFIKWRKHSSLESESSSTTHSPAAAVRNWQRAAQRAMSANVPTNKRNPQLRDVVLKRIQSQSTSNPPVPLNILATGNQSQSPSPFQNISNGNNVENSSA